MNQTHPNGRTYDAIEDWPRTPVRTHKEIEQLQDDVLVGLSSVQPKVHLHQLRRFPPWRAVLLARIAYKCGCLERRELDLMVREAQLVGGDGELKNP